MSGATAARDRFLTSPSRNASTTSGWPCCRKSARRRNASPSFPALIASASSHMGSSGRFAYRPRTSSSVTVEPSAASWSRACPSAATSDPNRRRSTEAAAGSIFSLRCEAVSVSQREASRSRYFLTVSVDPRARRLFPRGAGIAPAAANTAVTASGSATATSSAMTSASAFRRFWASTTNTPLTSPKSDPLWSAGTIPWTDSLS